MGKAQGAKRVNSGGGHSYRIDGERVDGVTTIIKNGVPAPGLIGWGPKVIGGWVADRLKPVELVLEGGTKVRHILADDIETGLAAFAKKDGKAWGPTWSTSQAAELLKQVHYADRDDAGVKGTKIHDLAFRLSMGEEVEVPPEYDGHVNAYLAFRDAFNPRNELAEVIVVNRSKRYMGTLDLIADVDLPVDWLAEHHPDLAELDRSLRALIDYKTNRGGPYADVALQLAGYRYAETRLDETGAEVPMPAVDLCFVLWLRDDGFDLIPFTAGPLEYRVFLYAQQVAWFGSEHWRVVKGQAVPAPPVPK